jgi:hypothetical protein
MVSDGDGDRAAAGADIGDAYEALVAWVGANSVERSLDESLGLGPWNQGAGANRKGQAVELALTKDVGQRLVGEAADQQLLE